MDRVDIQGTQQRVLDHNKSVADAGVDHDRAAVTAADSATIERIFDPAAAERHNENLFEMALAGKRVHPADGGETLE